MNSAAVISGSGSSAAATWEEKAFAEDASGSLGCIWPPRSYSCSFCMREFRSAQALGGHMNVHRRDRARLKQCLHNSNTNNNYTAATDHLHHHRGNSNSFLGASSELDPNFSRASALSTGPEVLRSFLSPYSGTAAAPSWSTEKLVLSVSSGIAKPTEEDDGLDYVETDLSVGLINSIVSRSRHHGGENDVEAAMMSCKRPKMGASIPAGPFPFFLQHPAAASSMEDLDLELRLGDPTPPKVK